MFMAGLALTAIFLITYHSPDGIYQAQRDSDHEICRSDRLDIHWPFIFEGLILGSGWGRDSLDCHLLWISGRCYLVEVQYLFPSVNSTENIMKEIARAIIPLGVVLGVLGSSISVRRFLKV